MGRPCRSLLYMLSLGLTFLPPSVLSLAPKPPLPPKSLPLMKTVSLLWNCCWRVQTLPWHQNVNPSLCYMLPLISWCRVSSVTTWVSPSKCRKMFIIIISNYSICHIHWNICSITNYRFCCYFKRICAFSKKFDETFALICDIKLFNLLFFFV